MRHFLFLLISACWMASASAQTPDSSSYSWEDLTAETSVQVTSASFTYKGKVDTVYMVVILTHASGKKITNGFYKKEGLRYRKLTPIENLGNDAHPHAIMYTPGKTPEFQFIGKKGFVITHMKEYH